MIGLNLDEAAADGEVFFDTLAANVDLAEVECRQQRAVVGQHAHAPLGAGQVDRIDLTAEDDAFLSDDVTLDSHISPKYEIRDTRYELRARSVRISYLVFRI